MALILRNGGSQSPDRWLKEPRNNHIEDPHRPFDDKDLFLANAFFNLFRKVYLKNLQNANNYAMHGQSLYHILTNQSLSSEEYAQLSLQENEA